MLLEDAVLLPQVFDDLKLVAIHPARKGHGQDPQRDRVEHEPSLSAWAIGLARLSLRPTFRMVQGSILCKHPVETFVPERFGYRVPFDKVHVSTTA